jgi:asparagine synthase (glutamine-hydrolysing)
MAGLAGIVRFDDRPIVPDALRAMADTMSYFGPDGFHAYEAPGISFGHLSLSTTPESRREALPAQSEDGRLLITADARIDNREPLLRSLLDVARGANVPDAILILAAYARWGENCPEHLVGDFAFAIWDQEERCVFCARDHLGSRPFFYSNNDRRFVFASAVKAILAVEDSPHRINDERVADFLLRLSSCGGITFFDGIYRIPPGYYLKIDGQRKVLRDYWRLASTPSSAMETPEFVEGFREIFEEAVRCRLRSSPSYGILLSGGLDSGSIACVAARELARRSEPLQAFCSVPLADYHDPAPSGWVAAEYPYVDEIRNQTTNLHVHYCPCEGWTPLTNVERTIWLLDGPFSFLKQFWISCLLAKAQKCGVRALLTGQLGNVAVSWEGVAYPARLAQTGRWLSMIKEVLATRKLKGQSFRHLLTNQVLIPLLPQQAWQSYVRRRDGGDPWLHYSPIHPEFARRMDLRRRIARRGLDPTFRPHPNGRIDRLRQIEPGQSDVGDRWSALGAGYQIEIMDPMGDKRLVEFCVSAPDSEFRAGGWDRLLLRKAMEGILPPRIQWRQDRGEQAPLRGQEPAIRDLVCRLDGSELWQRYIDVRRVRKIAEAPLEHGTIRLLWTALTLGIFLLSVENGSRQTTHHGAPTGR